MTLKVSKRQAVVLLSRIAAGTICSESLELFNIRAFDFLIVRVRVI